MGENAAGDLLSAELTPTYTVPVDYLQGATASSIKRRQDSKSNVLREEVVEVLPLVREQVEEGVRLLRENSAKASSP